MFSFILHHSPIRGVILSSLFTVEEAAASFSELVVVQGTHSGQLDVRASVLKPQPTLLPVDGVPRGNVPKLVIQCAVLFGNIACVIGTNRFLVG